MAGNLAVTAVLCLAIAVGLFLNGFLIFNFICRKRMRNIVTAPACILYVHLAVIDIAGSLLWTLVTALHASTGELSVPEAIKICDLQVYIRIFCNMANVMTLMLFMFERFVRIYKPSKHREVFFDLAALLMILAIYIFVGTLASFPLWGWGEVRYFEKEYQCSVAFENNPSYYDFSIAMSIGIPGGLILVGYAAILIRIFVLKRRCGPNGVVVLEEHYEVTGDSYSERLQKLYESFKDPENKPFKPRNGDKAAFEDTSYLDSDQFDSSDEGGEKGTGKEPKEADSNKKKPRKMPPKKCYYLGRNDLGLTHMYGLMSAVYIVLWLPYYIRFYQDTYQYYETSPSDGFILAAVCLSHLSGIYKVPFYLFSHTVRGAFKKTLGIGQEEKSNRKTRGAAE